MLRVRRVRVFGRLRVRVVEGRGGDGRSGVGREVSRGESRFDRVQAVGNLAESALLVSWCSRRGRRDGPVRDGRVLRGGRMSRVYGWTESSLGCWTSAGVLALEAVPACEQSQDQGGERQSREHSQLATAAGDTIRTVTALQKECVVSSVPAPSGPPARS